MAALIPPSTRNWTRTQSLALFLLSASSLTFEINLTRLFSVAQFYHFAFMIVSIALLGFGASGTFLAMRSSIEGTAPRGSLAGYALGASLSMIASYLLINLVPFDSFRIAWDRSQLIILSIHYLALALPFFFTGSAVGLLLSAHPNAAGSIYGTNLLGSAVGCALAMICPILAGGEGTVLVSSGLAAAAAIAWVSSGGLSPAPRRLMSGSAIMLLCFSLYGLSAQSQASGYPGWLALRLSPYKGLSYALQYPDSTVVASRWNAHSRVDLVRSQAIRSLPGLSYRYIGKLPNQDGLFVDADDLSPVVQIGEEMGIANFLPAAAAFQLREKPKVLILEPRGGLDVLTALASGAEAVHAVEPNALIIKASQHIYQHEKVVVFTESNRSFAHRSRESYDVVILSLNNSYHPVRSGAYSLMEDYRYTIEAFDDYLDRLNPEGLLVVTRWLQTPPSESLRAFATAVSALEKQGGSPGEQIAAFRGYNTATILVKKSPFSEAELTAIRRFTSSRSYDLIIAPGIRPVETNQFNVLPESSYYLEFSRLLETKPRQDYFRQYAYDVRPTSDDRPFFGHFYKWSQWRQVVSDLGKTWQPFGGAGYFVLMAILLLAGISAGLIVFLPVFISRRSRITYFRLQPVSLASRTLAYFSLIGFGFMLVEIPLIQWIILVLGQPAYSVSAVLFTLLSFSGLGSLASPGIPLRRALLLLGLVLIILPFLMAGIASWILGMTLSLRLATTILILAPVGFLMGIPFSGGILWLHREQNHAEIIPWAWAINGAGSVVASVLAALLAISFGFRFVFGIGAICYAGAWLAVRVRMSPHSPAPPDR